MSETLLDYYRKHSISTEHGVDAEWEDHLARRQKLYRQLGIPLLTLRGCSVLEVGPGEGHNTLPLLKEWGIAHVDLLEPNLIARSELEKKFEKYAVPRDKFTVYSDTLQQHHSEKKYDIVIAEAFFHNSEDWRECLLLLKKYVHKNTIVIVTCSDEISFYIEKMKRAVLQYYVKDIKKHNEKVRILQKIMKPQLAMLKGMSRAIEDWIEDMVFFPYCNEFMDMKKVIEEYSGEFDVLGASQNIFTDYSWFKDFEYDYISDYKRQYDEKKHMFMLAGDDYEIRRTIEENKALEEAVINANRIAKAIEDEDGEITDLISAVSTVSNYVINPIILQFNKELIKIIELLAMRKEINWNNYKTYMKSFGKTMQYISFTKK